MQTKKIGYSQLRLYPCKKERLKTLRKTKKYQQSIMYKTLWVS